MKDNSQSQEASSTHKESSSSEGEQDQKVTFQPSQVHLIPNIPCIEGPKMDWTINKGLYYRFLKWCLKCENILECQLDMLSERAPQEGNCLEW